MRLKGKITLRFYPLPVSEADRIRRFLRYPEKQRAALNPCIDDRVAFAAIPREAPVLRYGIELDAYPAEQARAVAHEVIRGRAVEVHCAVALFSLLYLIRSIPSNGARTAMGEWRQSLSSAFTRG